MHRKHNIYPSLQPEWNSQKMSKHAHTIFEKRCFEIRSQCGPPPSRIQVRCCYLERSGATPPIFKQCLAPSKAHRKRIMCLMRSCCFFFYITELCLECFVQKIWWESCMCNGFCLLWFGNEIFVLFDLRIIWIFFNVKGEVLLLWIIAYLRFVPYVWLELI